MTQRLTRNRRSGLQTKTVSSVKWLLYRSCFQRRRFVTYFFRRHLQFAHFMSQNYDQSSYLNDILEREKLRVVDILLFEQIMAVQSVHSDNLFIVELCCNRFLNYLLAFQIHPVTVPEDSTNNSQFEMLFMSRRLLRSVFLKNCAV